MKTRSLSQRRAAAVTVAVTATLCGALALSPAAAAATEPVPPTDPSTAAGAATAGETPAVSEAAPAPAANPNGAPASGSAAVAAPADAATPGAPSGTPDTAPDNPGANNPGATGVSPGDPGVNDGGGSGSTDATAAESTAPQPDPARDLKNVDTRITNVVLGVGSTNSERYLVWYTDLAHSTAPVVEVIRHDQLVNGQFPEAGATRYDGAQIVSIHSGQGKSRGFEAFSNKTVLRDLAPDTRYSYRIGDGSIWLGQWSFTTEAIKNDWSFFYFGDAQIGAKSGYRNANPMESSLQGDADGWQQTLNVATEKYPWIRTMVSAGDQIESTNKIKQHEYDSVKNPTEREYLGYTAPNQLKELQHAVSHGNHDWYYGAEDTYTEHWNIPNYDEQTMNYWWGQNNVLFLHLNTEFNREQHAPLHDSWMQKIIAEQGSKYQHIAVVMHRPLNSVGDFHSVSPATDRVRRVFGPLLKKHGINILFTGHDHTYSRSHPVDNYYPGVFKDGEWTGATGNYYNLGTGDNAPKEIYLTGDQFVSIVANSSSGSKYYDVHQTANHVYTAVINQDYVPEYTVVDVTQCSLTYRTHRAQAVGAHALHSIVDEFKVYLPYARPTLAAMPDITVTQSEAARLNLTADVTSSVCYPEKYPVVVSGSINTELLNTPQTVEYAIAPGTPWEVKQSRTVTVVADPLAPTTSQTPASAPTAAAPGESSVETVTPRAAEPGVTAAVSAGGEGADARPATSGSHSASQPAGLAKTGAAAGDVTLAALVAAALTVLGAGSLLRRRQQQG
ncbi:metallophosphoesterase family protein [Leucobacter sp. OH1287]|uniref:purple acid phosphatase family protein n=1 Tax=Leucobacter sp. OH1287 TaxID=2491049 RepID=UPI0013156C30|nr:metallophosphoesterase family protein [Leucobacter sp. OH1287]